MGSIDLTGCVFGRLTFMRYLGKSIWECRCDCGAVCRVNANNARRGHTQSCGCRKIEGRITHGMSHSREYEAWANIINRCCNPKHPNFPRYGGRGISMCTEWREDFTAFIAHIGPRPSDKHSVERIDNNRGYEPGNVRWATHLEQMHNTRGNVFVEIDGIRKTLGEWAREKDIHTTTLSHRIARGMTPRDAILTPPKFCGRRATGPPGDRQDEGQVRPTDFRCMIST